MIGTGGPCFSKIFQDSKTGMKGVLMPGVSLTRVEVVVSLPHAWSLKEVVIVGSVTL